MTSMTRVHYAAWISDLRSGVQAVLIRCRWIRCAPSAGAGAANSADFSWIWHESQIFCPVGSGNRILLQRAVPGVFLALRWRRTRNTRLRQEGVTMTHQEFEKITDAQLEEVAGGGGGKGLTAVEAKELAMGKPNAGSDPDIAPAPPSKKPKPKPKPTK